MKVFKSIQELLEYCIGTVELVDNQIEIKNVDNLRNELIDILIYNGVLNDQLEIRDFLFWFIWEIGKKLNIRSASIQELYGAKEKNELSKITIPAFNIRGFTYYTAISIIKSAIKNQVGAFIFQLSKSEIGYTFQRPQEYTMNCIAAAIKEGYEGPVFFQGDHYHVNLKNFNIDRTKELNTLRSLIDESIIAGFYNYNIDCSNLVSLEKPTVKDQQQLNCAVSAALTRYIRENEPKGITISIGGEVGYIKDNQNGIDHLEAFIKGYLEILNRMNEKNPVKSLNKISFNMIQSQNKISLADGKAADMPLDFQLLKSISDNVRNKYNLAGLFLRGELTLSESVLNRFPEVGIAEVHFATEIQNLVYDSEFLPNELKEQIYGYLESTFIHEKNESETMEEFYYKTRKKGFGSFKQEFFNLAEDSKNNIIVEIEKEINMIFDKLNCYNTKQLVEQFVKPVDIMIGIPARK